jgi:hypothetical protein
MNTNDLQASQDVLPVGVSHRGHDQRPTAARVRFARRLLVLVGQVWRREDDEHLQILSDVDEAVVFPVVD